MKEKRKVFCSVKPVDDQRMFDRRYRICFDLWKTSREGTFTVKAGDLAEAMQKGEERILEKTRNDRRDLNFVWGDPHMVYE